MKRGGGSSVPAVLIALMLSVSLVSISRLSEQKRSALIAPIVKLYVTAQAQPSLLCSTATTEGLGWSSWMGP